MRIGAGLEVLIDNPTVRLGQSPAPDPAGGRGEGRDFLREAPNRPWEGGERGCGWGGTVETSVQSAWD